MNDKSKPWLNEPDFIKWIDPETGYRCVIRRVPQMLHLCGYVRVPRSHPLYRKDYMSGKVGRLDVHGGITATGRPRLLSMAPIRGYWLGFDCAHYTDLVPGFRELPSLAGLPQHGAYRDIAYVKSEVTLLAIQLKDMQK